MPAFPEHRGPPSLLVSALNSLQGCGRAATAVAGDLILVEADGGRQLLADSTSQTRFTLTMQDCYSCVSETLLC